MNLKIRYGLIAAGFITFSVLAPLILLYVRGLSFNTKNLTTDQTGIISIQSEPKSADVFLNNKKTGTTPENIRFLKTGDYEIRLQKPGYFTWSKRLNVLAGKVTWATQDVSKVHLLKQDSEKLKLDSGVKDFFRTDSEVVYLTDQAINKLDLSEPAQKHIQALNKDEYKFLTSSNKKHSLIIGSKNNYSYSLESNKLTKIQNLPFSPIQISNSGSIFALEKNNLITLDKNLITKKTLKNNIYAFFETEDNLYTLSKKTNTWQLEFLEQQNQYTPQTIFETSIELIKPEIYVSPERRIYIKDEQKLYRFAGELELIFSFTNTFIKSDVSEKLIISALGEIHLYNPYTNELKLINRSLEGYSNPLLRDDLGYIIFTSGSNLKAIELDTRDRSNIFSLDSIKNSQKISCDSLAKNLVYLDDSDLKFLEIQ